MSEKERKLIINITLFGIILVFVLALIIFPKQKDTFIDSSTKDSFSSSYQTDVVYTKSHS